MRREQYSWARNRTSRLRNIRRVLMFWILSSGVIVSTAIFIMIRRAYLSVSVLQRLLIMAILYVINGFSR